ncbi:hypothetical protein PIB30_091988, partial [Stylosanthes scabra]|nr:hypothetical protein [Stylosanthes scabra]
LPQTLATTTAVTAPPSALLTSHPLFNLSLTLTPSTTTTVASPRPEAQLSHLVAIAATLSQQQRGASFPSASSIPLASSFPFSAIFPNSSIVPLSAVASRSVVPTHSTFLNLLDNWSDFVNYFAF